MEFKKKIWLNYIASQLTVKDKTFGHLLSMNTGKKKNFKSSSDSFIKKKNLMMGKSVRDDNLKLNIEPGTVLILLSKKFLGKKVVLLNKTDSNLFVVTGPFPINGISMRRVNPRYTISSGAKIDISKLTLFGLNDEYFENLKKSKHNYNGYKSGIKKSNYMLSHRIRQYYIDNYLIENLKKDFFLRAYLKTKTPLFSFN